MCYPWPNTPLCLVIPCWQDSLGPRLLDSFLWWCQRRLHFFLTANLQFQWMCRSPRSTHHSQLCWLPLTSCWPDTWHYHQLFEHSMNLVYGLACINYGSVGVHNFTTVDNSEWQSILCWLVFIVSAKSNTNSCRI